jgi:ketosteroid isomerase-like protein
MRINVAAVRFVMALGALTIYATMAARKLRQLAIRNRGCSRRWQSINNNSSEGRIMKKVAVVMAVAVFASGAANASDRTDVMAVVHKWVDAFNKGDGKTGSSYCADGALVIDDFAPHVWQGSGACASWYKDYEAFAAKAQISDASVALGKARHLDIDSGYAYLVTPTTLTFTKAGKPVTDKAIVTMSLKKGSSGWQITGWAWADQ